MLRYLRLYLYFLRFSFSKALQVDFRGRIIHNTQNLPHLLVRDLVDGGHHIQRLASAAGGANYHKLFWTRHR